LKAPQTGKRKDVKPLQSAKKIFENPIGRVKRKKRQNKRWRKTLSGGGESRKSPKEKEGKKEEYVNSGHLVKRKKLAA